MKDRELHRIADRMMTSDFVVSLFYARQNMNRADALGQDYDEASLARDIGVPVAVARLLICFITATQAENLMCDMLERRPQTEARH